MIITEKLSLEKDIWDCLAYSHSGGMFFLLNKKRDTVTSVYSCREEFSWAWRPSIRPCFGFGSPNGNIARFVKKFQDIENQLGIPEEEQSVLYTNVKVHESFTKNKLIILNPSKFWLENSCRRSLLTLYIRGFLVFETLDEYKLATYCMPAIKRFLSGYTKFSPKSMRRYGYSNGFVDYFRDRTENELKELLTK